MAITLGSSTLAYTTDGNSVTTTGINTTGASLIVVAAGYYALGAGLTVTDNKVGNTWSPLTEKIGAGNNAVRLFYCVPVQVGTGHTFSFGTSSSSGTIAVVAINSAAASPFDVENGATPTSITTFQTGSVSPSEDNEIILTAANINVTSAHSIDSGFQSLGANLGHGAPGYDCNLDFACLIQTTKGAVNPTWGCGDTTSPAAVIATFKPAAPTGGGPAIWSRNTNQII